MWDWKKKLRKWVPEPELTDLEAEKILKRMAGPPGLWEMARKQALELRRMLAQQRYGRLK